MSWLADTRDRRRLRQALSRHLPALLRGIVARDGDLRLLARALGWASDAQLAPFVGHVSSLACEDIRQVLEEHLRDAYRHRGSRSICLPLRMLKRPAIVFTEEHGQCMLIGGESSMRELRVVGPGLHLGVINPNMVVVAPSRAWLDANLLAHAPAVPPAEERDARGAL